MRTNTEHPHTTSEPSTGSHYLDRAIDGLPVEAKVAMIAMLERHGQDPAIDLARARLESQMERFASPETLDEYCRSVDDSGLEETIGFWMAYRAGWQSRS
jgi:hypothetical protein